MAQSSGAYGTYDGAGKELREDIINILTDISPTETPLMTGLRVGPTAKSKIHEFVYDTISRNSSVDKSNEAQDIAFSDITAPTRDTNYVQEIDKSWKVSDAMESSDTVGGSEIKRMKAKKLKEIKLSLEYSLLHGTGISGLSGTAAEMKGILYTLLTTSGNTASQAASNATVGATITQGGFDDDLEMIYADVEDDALEWYGNMTKKRQISSFTGGVTKNVDANDKRLVLAIDVYESDLGMVKLFAHRDLIGSRHSFVIQPRAWYISYMDKPKHNDYPRQGNYKAGWWHTAATLEFRQPKAGVVRTA